WTRWERASATHAFKPRSSLWTRAMSFPSCPNSVSPRRDSALSSSLPSSPGAFPGVSLDLTRDRGDSRQDVSARFARSIGVAIMARIKLNFFFDDEAQQGWSETYWVEAANLDAIFQIPPGAFASKVGSLALARRQVLGRSYFLRYIRASDDEV